MLINIFYFIGVCIFIINAIMLTKAKEALKSLEWLILYKSAGRIPNKERINYSLVTLWLASSILSSFWLLFGLLSDDWRLFLFLSILNFISNYLLSKNKGQIKINLSFLKSVILNLILASLLFSFYYKLFLHK